MATQPFSRERWTHNGESTLNIAASITDTTITVNDASSFPSSARFSIIIDDTDIHTVTKVASNVFTVDPAISSAHAQYVSVKHIITNRSIDDAIKEAGHKLLYPMNRILDKDGNTLTASDFTWLNEGSATCVDADDGGLNMTFPSEAFHNVRGKYITAPSTPWTITAHFQFGPGFENWSGGGVGSNMGIMCKETATDKMYMQIISGSQLAFWKMDDTTTFNTWLGNLLDNNNFNVWMQFEDDGTDVYGRVSYNGYDFMEQWTEGRTTFLSGGIGQIGFAAQSGSGRAGQLFHIKSWIVE